jgi:signal transduction histidine kinase
MGLATVQRMKSSREWVLHTFLVRGLLKDLRSSIAESHANFDLYQLSRNPDEARDLENQSQRQLGNVERLLSLTVDNPQQQERLMPFRRVLLEDIQQLRDCVSGAKCLGAGPASESDKMAAIVARRKTMTAMLLGMEDLEQQLLDDRLKVLDQLFTRMVITLVGSFFLALVLLLYNVNLLNREIERGKQQEWIEKKNAESYRMLSARILELQDVERRKIARELHDSVGQYLAGLKLNLGRLQRREAEPGIQNSQLLAESLDVTDRAILEVRTISHLLHPPLLDELGLASALRWYVEGFSERSKITVDVEIPSDLGRLPTEQEIAIFRIVQECLTNIHRHADSKTAAIRIHRDAEQIVVVAEDSGRGIPEEKLQSSSGGVGFRGMHERIRYLGGKLELHSNSNGTVVTAILPLEQASAAGAGQ